MNFFEGLGMFVVALVVFLMSSFAIGFIFTSDKLEWIYIGAWISGSVIYAITIVLMIYITRSGYSL